MEGKVVLVTGATNGIGEATARELARRGATVVGVSRSADKCAAVEAAIRQATGNPRVTFFAADLSARAEVHRAADVFLGAHDRLDVLVNNVGGIFGARAESADGIELTWALNHLGYFALTHRLIDRLRATAETHGTTSRVVNVSSDAHRAARINFDDVEFRAGYSAFGAYGQSKLANVMFTYELARRLQGAPVTVNALHPGFVASGFGRSTFSGVMAAGMGLMMRLAARSPERGAETSIHLAAAPEVAGVTGKYFADCREKRSSQASYDGDAARRLWELSERMTGM